MTREQAIMTLIVVDENATCDDCLYYNQMEDCPNDEDCIIRQAIDMAIKALEQELSGDLISRQDVIKVLTKNRVHFCDMVKVTSELKDLPSVNPQEPKMGHWIKYGELYQCSECKELSCCQGKFCNECGAKMFEPQESEEA